jgi:2,3-bisphosphoglycerate-independent phosphoglycerate mutase
MKKKLITLIILDGFGINEREEGNAVIAARTPNIDSYYRSYPNTRIRTSGLDVGLPSSQMGNSEVSHPNLLRQVHLQLKLLDTYLQVLASNQPSLPLSF